MENQSIQPGTQHPPSQGLRLDTIAADVQHIIAAELAILSPPSILAMAQISRTLRQVALPLIYQEVVLRREIDESRTLKAYEALVELFQSGREGSIARHVRHLVVRGELPTDDLLMILATISEFGFLRKLSWETTAHMPPLVLDKLHKTWPDLELSVRVLGRRHGVKSSHRQMDEQLLSSSLLRSLTYEVTYQGYEADHSASLEWGKLTRAISVSSCLRVLRIQIYMGGERSESNPQLALPQDFQLPALEEFALYGAYDLRWTDEHCQMLDSSVGMSTLHTLNFARGMPTSFFRTFTGRLPGLKTLRLEITRNANVEVTADFIKSIEGLELLDIDGPASVIDVLWPAIVQHRTTLKRLYLRQHIEIGRLEEVSNSFPCVERLGWNVLYKDRANCLALVSCMKLERLDLFMDIPGSANDYCGKLIAEGMGAMRSPSLDKKRSQAAAVEMMQNLAIASGHWPERLTLHLTRMSYCDRADPYRLWAKLQVRHSKRAGVHDHFEFCGKQEWNSREEDLELEWPVLF